MTEFYTQETFNAIYEQEAQMERMYDAMIEAYDPYMDFDDEDFEDDYEEGYEDRGMEGYLFGWDS